MNIVKNLLLVVLLAVVLVAWVMLPWPGAVLLAVLVGALPAWNAMRLNIVDALAGR